MKNEALEIVNAVRPIWIAGLCLALILTSGCAAFRESVSGKSWSQTAAEEQQALQLSAAPETDLGDAP